MPLLKTMIEEYLSDGHEISKNGLIQMQLEKNQIQAKKAFCSCSRCLKEQARGKDMLWFTTVSCFLYLYFVGL